MCLAGGHTASDCVLCLLDEGIVFMGDLLFFNHHPYLEDGDPDEWLRSLEAIRGLNPKILVPGHGPVGALADLKPMRQYVGTLDELARKMVQDGETEARIAEMAIPEPFARWRFAPFFAPNIQFMYQRQLSKQGPVSI
jgi:cyclase